MRYKIRNIWENTRKFAVMAWTNDDLTELTKAIALGAVRVKYADKEVEYRSLADMIALKNAMETELGVKKKGSRVLTTFNKGINNC